MKRAKIVLETKDPDGWGEVADALGLTDKQRDRFFEFGEYATVELEFDEKLNVVRGRVLPVKR